MAEADNLVFRFTDERITVLTRQLLQNIPPEVQHGAAIQIELGNEKEACRIVIMATLQALRDRQQIIHDRQSKLLHHERASFLRTIIQGMPTHLREDLQIQVRNGQIGAWLVAFGDYVLDQFDSATKE